jgi:hypothetical protein
VRACTGAEEEEEFDKVALGLNFVRNPVSDEDQQTDWLFWSFSYVCPEPVLVKS